MVMQDRAKLTSPATHGSPCAITALCACPARDPGAGHEAHKVQLMFCRHFEDRLPEELGTAQLQPAVDNLLRVVYGRKGAFPVVVVGVVNDLMFLSTEGCVDHLLLADGLRI